MNQNKMRDFLQKHNHVEKVKEVSGTHITFKTMSEYLDEELLTDIIEEHRSPQDLIFKHKGKPRTYRLSEKEE